MLGRRIEAADHATGMKGKIKHSVCRWCFSRFTMEDLCTAAVGIGLSSIELLTSEDFGIIKKHGLTCAMVQFRPWKDEGGKEVNRISVGFNHKENHENLIAAYETQINEVAEAGFKNLICFSGNRAGMDDETGMNNCAEGLKRLMPLCEKKGVVLCMELLNSKVNHPDYQCDRSAWGVELCKRVGSEHFKLLYDIYHMQVMEGDVIGTIYKNNSYFAHYHTAGVPGRHEIDETQELNYPAIMRAIFETGYTGYVGQEFLPAKPDALDSLKKAVQICDV